MKLVSNPSPFILLPLKKEREELFDRGFAPIKYTYPPSLDKGRWQGDRILPE
jgi:hypothetical protein